MRGAEMNVVHIYCEGEREVRKHHFVRLQSREWFDHSDKQVPHPTGEFVDVEIYQCDSCTRERVFGSRKPEKKVGRSRLNQMSQTP